MIRLLALWAFFRRVWEARREAGRQHEIALIKWKLYKAAADRVDNAWILDKHKNG
jgi:hypothetical protein